MYDEKMNQCPVCGYDAKLSAWQHNHHQVFVCTSRSCRVIFEQTGLGPELLPSDFEVGEIYGIMVWSDTEGDIPIELELIDRSDKHIRCLVNDVADVTFKLYKQDGCEYVKLDELGIEEKIFAYVQE